MLEWFSSLNYVIQALIATIFTWTVTALGASIVFLFKKINKSIMDAMLGFAAGVMIAASFWSLLSPSIEMSKTLNLNPWLIASIGFILGGLLLFIGDKIFDRLEKNKNKNEKNKMKRCMMLIFSITLHNIPEGLAGTNERALFNLLHMMNIDNIKCKYLKYLKPYEKDFSNSSNL